MVLINSFQQKWLGQEEIYPGLPSHLSKVRKSGNANDWAAFKSIRKYVNMKIKQAHDQYVLGLLDDSSLSDNSVLSNYFKLGKQFWQYVRSKKKGQSQYSYAES